MNHSKDHPANPPTGGFFRRSNWIIGVALVVLALPLIVPFLQSGLQQTADIEIHMYRIMSVVSNFRAGYLWPRWTPYLHQGFGYPINEFYAPAFHILGAIIYLITGLAPANIIKLLQIVFTLLYPVSAYLFARTLTGRPGAFVAAAAYTYAPFRFQELWVQDNLSQFAAMALLPLVLAAITYAARSPRLRHIAATGMVFALVILLHHPTAFLFAPFAGLYAILMAYIAARDVKSRAGIRAILRQGFVPLMACVAGLTLGLALAAIYWLPALLELRYTAISSIQSGMFSVTENFVPLDVLFAGIAPYDRAVLNPLPIFKIGPAQYGFAVLALLVLIFRWRRSDLRTKIVVIAGIVTLALCAYLITPASLAVWTAIPIANLVVYPWRLLGVIAVAALPGATVLPAFLGPRWQKPVAGLLVGIFLVTALPLLYVPLTFKTEPAGTAQDEILYEQHTGNVGLTSGDEYLPIWATQRPLYVALEKFQDRDWFVYPDDRNPPPPEVKLQEDRNCGIGKTCYQVDTPHEYVMMLHQMYFPGWTITVNGQPVEPSPTGELGMLSGTIPAGESRVEIWYGGTPLQHTATVISILAVLLTAGLLLRSVILPVPTIAQPDEAPATGFAVCLTAVLLGFIVINQVIIGPGTTLFRARSDPSSPPMQHPAHVVFGDTLELLGYDLNTTSAAPGDLVVVQLYWRLLKSTSENYRGAVKLESLNQQMEWGGSTSLNLAKTVTSQWPLDQYAIDEYRFQVSKDALPFVGELRVSVFTGVTDLTYLSVTGGAQSVVISSFRVTGTQAISDIALTPAEVNFGNTVSLLGYSLSADDKLKCIVLRWQVQGNDLPEYAVLLHFQDQNTQFLQAADGPPLDGLYPSNAWLKGQTLDDKHCFTVPPQAATLGIGLYRRDDTSRLAANTAQGNRLQDDIFTIPLPGN